MHNKRTLGSVLGCGLGLVRLRHSWKAFNAAKMNRRMRNRTSGGVGGRQQG